MSRSTSYEMTLHFVRAMKNRGKEELGQRILNGFLMVVSIEVFLAYVELCSWLQREENVVERVVC